MITRAQAEALLTLAESLEACERQQIKIVHTHGGIDLFYGGKYTTLCHFELNSMAVRIAVNALIPKQEQSS